MKSSSALLAATVGAVMGCADDPVQPNATRLAGANASVASPSGTTHIVEFNGRAGANLAAQVAALGGTVDYIVESAGFAGVSGLSAQAAATLGRKVGLVYPDVDVQLDVQAAHTEVQAADVEAASVANPAGSFLFAWQWNMRAISAHSAWAAAKLGSPAVTVAILDTGIDYDNLDMTGIVDLARSTSFVPSDDAFIATLLPGRNPLDDLHGHGTNVATQVSTNGTVFAGVNSLTRLIGVKVLGRTGAGSLGAVLAGLIWAADHGADVANLSLGVPNGFDKAHSGFFLGLTNRVFNYAHRKGMMVVVGAGNNAADMDNEGRIDRAYCESPHVICVSATGPTASTNLMLGPWTNVDALASYSNFGKQVSVAAPGGTAAGFVWSLCARRRAVVSATGVVSFPCNVALPSIVLRGLAGTSQATPHVSGVVAQIIATHGKSNPSQIKQLLLQAVDDLGPAGDDPFFGAGRVNVAKAVGL